MSSFVSTIQAKPAIVAAAGAASGTAGVVVTWTSHLELFFRLVAAGFGALGAVIAVLLVLPRAARFVDRWRKRGFLNADRE